MAHTAADIPTEILDAAGHRWAPVVDSSFVEAMKDVGVDVARLVRREPGKLIAALTGNPKGMCSALFQSCERQADAQNVTPAMFIRLLADTGTGTVMGDMVTMLLLAIARHYPESRFGRLALINPRALFHIGRGRG